MVEEKESPWQNRFLPVSATVYETEQKSSSPGVRPCVVPTSFPVFFPSGAAASRQRWGFCRWIMISLSRAGLGHARFSAERLRLSITCYCNRYPFSPEMDTSLQGTIGTPQCTRIQKKIIPELREVRTSMETTGTSFSPANLYISSMDDA